MHAELQSLKIFRGKLEKILIHLRGTEADPQRVADNHLVAAQLGANFPEVDSLHGAYNDIHGQLKTLISLLNDQIEALSTAVHAARVGYANVDEDLRARMAAIQARTHALYDPGLDPHPPKTAPRTPPAARPAPKGSEEGSM
ncbi:hypothetical protein [Streptomyces griseocarneus]|uniref:hypothetical protein n=1 Tax=Streptomyces griseocarneus TaxID=51201 RepID=UPI00167DEBD1|nr:hypothetical protein [Streptomyces griseocarneus]MBZ6477108.1 hypothetical protein [Streptomyces griseocarneus]GHG70505.1 hypothetical protein GCM10018779_44640 [Streptomyces griseocarneus]